MNTAKLSIKVLLVSAFAIMVLLLSSCGEKNGQTGSDADTTTVPEVSSETEIATENEEEESLTDTEEISSEEETQEESTAEAEPKTEKKTEKETESSKLDVSKMSKEEIIDYYNKAANSAKSDSKSIHSNYMRHSVVGEMLNIPRALDSVGQKLIRDNMGEDKSKTNVTWVTAADKNKYFPVENESYASKLAPADVKSADIKEVNGKYVITIVTVDDPRNEGYSHSIGHAPKAFNAVLPSIIDAYIPGLAKSLFKVGTVALAYPSSTVVATVDPDSGHMEKANYKLYWTLYIPLSGTDVTLPFMTENDYVVNW